MRGEARQDLLEWVPEDEWVPEEDGDVHVEIGLAY
jgi:hypothetical protein